MKLGLLTYNVAPSWDLATLLGKAKALGFEGVSFRVDRGHAHGVELNLNPAQRQEVREGVAAAGLEICGLSGGCYYDSLDTEELRQQIEHTKDLLQLTADVGAPGLKVFGNNFHEEEGVPRQQTIKQIVSALKECAQFGAELGVEVRFEMHGDLNPWQYSVKIMEIADESNLSLIYNSDPRDVVDGSIRETLEHIRPWLRHVHLHDLSDTFPYRELFRFLVEVNYDGYTVAELPGSPDPERVLRYFRALWQAYVDLALKGVTECLDLAWN